MGDQVPANLVAVLVVGVSLVELGAGAWHRRRERAARSRADRRIDDLESRFDRLSASIAPAGAGPGPAPAEAGPSLAPEPARPTPAGPVFKRPAPVHRSDPGSPAVPTLIAVPNLAIPPGEGPSTLAASADLSRRFSAILSRAEAGESAEVIARATGLPIGRVELILGLRRQSSAAYSVRLTPPAPPGQGRP